MTTRVPGELTPPISLRGTKCKGCATQIYCPRNQKRARASLTLPRFEGDTEFSVELGLLLDRRSSKTLSLAAHGVGARGAMRSVRERRSDLFDAPGSAREEKLRLLATASQVLAASFDLSEPLRHVAQLAVGRLADIALIHLLGEKGDLTRAATASGEAGPEPPPAPIGPDDLALLRRVLSSGRPILLGKYAAGAQVIGQSGSAGNVGTLGNFGLSAKSLMLLPL